MFKNWTYCSLETTGLSHSEDEIYLVNLLKNGKYIPIWLKEGDEKSLTEYFKEPILTFSGKRFEEPFLKAKKIKLESFDLRSFLKNWVDFKGSLKLSDLAEKYNLKEPKSFRERQKDYRKYKETKDLKLKEGIEKQGKISAELRRDLWEKILEEMEKRSFSFGQMPGISIFLYHYKIEKDFLEIRFLSREKLPEIFIQEEFLLKNDGHFLIVKFPLQRGNYEGREISCISYSKMETDFQGNFYQIEEEGSQLEENMKKVIKILKSELKKE